MKIEDKKPNQTAKIISGFPGVGKSFLTNANKTGLKVIDSDSTQFSKLSDGKTPNAAWPQNYIDHIKAQSSQVDVIFVSTHKETRALLVENKIPFTLVYPEKALKSEYMDRYKNRGTPEFLQNILDKNWNAFIDECEEQKDCNHVRLSSGQFMADVASDLVQSEDQRPGSSPEAKSNDGVSHTAPLSATAGVSSGTGKKPVRIHGGHNDARHLDYNREFASEEELARYVVDKTPIFEQAGHWQKMEDSEAIEKGDSALVLRNHGVTYDLE